MAPRLWKLDSARSIVEFPEIEATTTVDEWEFGMTFNPLGMIRAPSALHVSARLTPDRGQP